MLQGKLDAGGGARPSGCFVESQRVQVSSPSKYVQYLGFLIPRTMRSMGFGSRNLKSWALGRSGSPTHLYYDAVAVAIDATYSLDRNPKLLYAEQKPEAPLKGASIFWTQTCKIMAFWAF